MFAKKLKALMKAKEISVSELSRKTGIPRTNLNQWLGGSLPNIIQVDKLASFFEMSVDELVFDRKPKVEEFFTETLIHSGEYRISVTKLTKKDGDEK